MRSRRCSGPGRLSGDTGMSGRRVTSKAPLGPTWKEGQATPRRRPQPFSRILTAWKWNSANVALTEFYEVRIHGVLREVHCPLATPKQQQNPSMVQK
jgi:hypothetical protein